MGDETCSKTKNRLPFIICCDSDTYFVNFGAVFLPDPIKLQSPLFHLMLQDLGQIHKELSPLPFKQKMPHEHKALEKIEQPASESRQSASKHKSHTHHGNLKIPTKGGTRIVQGEGHATVVCKLEPYNVCFRINPDTGVGRPTGEVRYVSNKIT